MTRSRNIGGGHIGGSSAGIPATKPGGFWLPHVGHASAEDGTRNYHCPGCRDHPDPLCAACGAPTAVRLAGPEDEHTMTLCRRCWRALMACRAQTTVEIALYEERRAAKHGPALEIPAPAPKPKRPRRVLTDEQKQRYYAAKNAKRRLATTREPVEVDEGERRKSA